MKNRIPPLKKTLRVKKSGIHERGVFAVRNIKNGEYIIRYLGKKITYAQAEKLPERYHFELNSRYKIDGRNAARYINHSCNPNCYSELYGGVIWIVALRDIRRGEELTYNYGYNYREGLDYPCLCRTPNCVGFIMDDAHWHRIKKPKK